jgi:hypothetical protein
VLVIIDDHLPPVAPLPERGSDDGGIDLAGIIVEQSPLQAPELIGGLLDRVELVRVTLAGSHGWARAGEGRDFGSRRRRVYWRDATRLL